MYASLYDDFNEVVGDIISMFVFAAILAFFIFIVIPFITGFSMESHGFMRCKSTHPVHGRCARTAMRHFGHPHVGKRGGYWR